MQQQVLWEISAETYVYKRSMRAISEISEWKILSNIKYYLKFLHQLMLQSHAWPPNFLILYCRKFIFWFLRIDATFERQKGNEK